MVAIGGRATVGSADHPLSKSLTSRRDLKQNVDFSRKWTGLGGGGKRISDKGHKGTPVGTTVVSVKKKGFQEKLGCTLEDMKISRIENGSAADRSGLSGFMGRQLTHINGVKVSSVDQVREESQRHSKMSLTFKEAPLWERGGRRSLSQKTHSQYAKGTNRKHTPEGCTSSSRTAISQSCAVGEGQSEPRSIRKSREGLNSMLSMPIGLRAPFGTGVNQDLDTSHKPRRRYPLNLSSDQMRAVGFSPGGGRLGEAATPRASPSRKGRGSVASPRSSVSMQRTFRRSSSLPGSGTYRSDHGNVLAHDDSQFHCTTPLSPYSRGLRQFPPPESRPSSPTGRRRNSMQTAFSFNSAFLVDPGAPASPRPSKNYEFHSGRDHGDIIGRKYGTMANNDNLKYRGKLTAPVVVSLPEPVYKFKGATKQHPHPTPALSDIFNSRQYAPKTCSDMRDVMGTHGKGHSRPQNQFQGIEHTHHMTRRRSYTPQPSPTPPWDTTMG